MNEPEEGVAPTDSRLRPDQRMMENGDWDDANVEKIRLEEKQRAVRRRREAADKQVGIIGTCTITYPNFFLILFRPWRRAELQSPTDLLGSQPKLIT